MQKLITWLRNPVWLIILAGVGLRSYHSVQFYTFEHDQDLFSWIVKDIIVNHHFRLIGQLTSIDGFFIGPLFYYALVPFFLLTKMDPVGGLILGIILSAATIYSFYFCFSRLFSPKIGLIAAFVYAVSVGTILFDIWIVPTLPVIAWTIWYLFVIFRLAEGKFKVLPILGILLGLIWHIHIAVIPLVSLIPIALFVSRKSLKYISKRDLIVSLAAFSLLISPYILFELRHHFSQTLSLISTVTINRDEPSGVYRFLLISEHIVRLFRVMLFSGGYQFNLEYTLFWPVVLSLTYFSIKKKILSNNHALLILAWIIVIFLGQQLSKRSLSEYYFLNLFPLFLLIFLLPVKLLNNKIIYSLGAAYLVFNIFAYFTQPIPQAAYPQKKDLVDFITQDSQKYNFPCVGINYIAKFGTAVGYRYLMWFNKLQTVTPSNDVPVYNIVIPVGFAKNVDYRVGDIGVITPKNSKFNSKACNDPKYQMLPLLGYTQ